MDRLSALLLEWEERRDRGDPVTPDDLCGGDTALAVELSKQIRRLEEGDRLLGIGDDLPTVPPWPSRIGKYEIRGLLGRGGMGVVYDGWDPVLRRRVAVKMILPPFAAAAVARFGREGELLAKLDHPGIVPIYEAGVHDGHPYLVVKFVLGGSLAEHRERITEAGPVAIRTLMAKVAQAVQYAHAQGVLHRDLKPGNILLGPGDEPLVADFGLAKLLADEVATEVAPPDSQPAADLSRHTTGGTQPGTPAYMAPEQFDPSRGPISPAVDVWAIGAILYELLNGTKPFKGADRDAIFRQVLVGPTPPDTRQRTTHGKRLAAVAEKCLRTEPSQRYATVGEVAAVLASLGRWQRRVKVAVALLALVALALALGGFERWYNEPERVYIRATGPLVQKLGNQEAIDLIRPGVAPPHRIRSSIGYGATKVTASSEGLEIDSPGLAIVELLPSIPIRKYTVLATMRHDHSFYDQGRLSYAGLVTAAFHHEDPRGRQHLIRLASLSECMRAESIPVGVSSFWIREANDGPPKLHEYAMPNSTDSLPADLRQSKPWVDLVIQTNESGATARFTVEGHTSRPLASTEGVYRKHKASATEKHVEASDVRFPEVSRQTLSVFVSGGKCTVSRIRIIPVDSSNP